MSQVTVEIRGPVLIVSLDDPGTRNAMTADMAHEVASALDRLDESPELHVGVLYGLNGVFSSGMNLKAFRTTGRRPIHPERGGGGIVWSPPRKPMIAAVEGYAYGLGFEMVLACDLVVAAADARMALPEVKHGLVAAGGGALRLPSRIPRAAAMEMLLTGEPCQAPRLHELGLVNRVVAPGAALHEAMTMANSVAALPTAALQFTKQLVTESRDWPGAEMFAHQEPRVAEFLAGPVGPAATLSAPPAAE